MGELLESVRQSRSPQEAIAYLAVGIEQIIDLLSNQQPNDPWKQIEWVAGTDAEPMLPSDAELIEAAYNDMEAAEPDIIETEEEVIVDIKPVNDARMEARRQFEREHLKIGECLGGDADPNIDYTEIYAKAGPLWLYHGNLDLFMSYDYATRRAMVQDVVETAPKSAHDMALWALKEAGESGPGSVAMGAEAAAVPQRARIWTR